MEIKHINAPRAIIRLELDKANLPNRIIMISSTYDNDHIIERDL